MTAPIAERLRALAAYADMQHPGRQGKNPKGWRFTRDELLAITEECERIAGEMRERVAENRVDGGYYTLGWADALAGRQK